MIKKAFQLLLCSFCSQAGDDNFQSKPSLRRAFVDARKKLLNVVSLSLAGSSLEAEIDPPTAVTECELIKEVWPCDVPGRPQVLKFALMSPAGCYTDFHLDYGGSSVWYHVVSGRKVFLVVPPTDENIQLFTAWAASVKQGSVFLGEHVKGTRRVEVSYSLVFHILVSQFHCQYLQCNNSYCNI